MAEYIEREALLEKANELSGGSFSTSLIISAIEKAPTADVVEVRRGEWVNEGNYLYTCSLCGDKALLRLGGKPCNYCPNCGAKMDSATDTNVGGKTEVEKGTNFDRIKGMSVEEMARFFATDRLPDFPHLPCYICEHDGDYGCKKEDECSVEHETKVYRKWLESEV